MDIHESNETSELKNFMSRLRSGNLLKLIESNQTHVQDKYQALCTKIKQREEDIAKQILILQQNSHLIEKFQKQLQELSNQNSELFDQQQALKNENENLKNNLQCSEDKFAQLDIVYDQQVSASSERINELETQVTELEKFQNRSVDQFDQSQTESSQSLIKSEQEKAELEKQLQILVNQHETEKNELKTEIAKVYDLNAILQNKLNSSGEKISDLQENLAAALDENRIIEELKTKIDNVNNDREVKCNEYRAEKSQLIAKNKELELCMKDLKRKLSNKEKEAEEIYMKYKSLTRFGLSKPEYAGSIQSSRYSSKPQASTDGPKTIYNTSDSDSSSVSVYVTRKRRNPSTDANQLNIFQHPSTKSKIQKMTRSNQVRTSAIPSLGIHHKASLEDYENIEIPESPVVSSSAAATIGHKT